MRSFLEVDDLTVEELNRVIDLCLTPNPPKVLQGEGAALVFEKPSNRTRNSMEMAVHQLGKRIHSGARAPPSCCG